MKPPGACEGFWELLKQSYSCSGGWTRVPLNLLIYPDLIPD